MSLEERLEWASEKLPDCWNIQIQIENGYGGVNLFDPSGHSIHLDQTEMDFEEMVEKAVLTAISIHETP